MDQHLRGPFLEMNIGVDGDSPSISCLSGPACLFGYGSNGSLHLAAWCWRTPPTPSTTHTHTLLFSAPLPSCLFSFSSLSPAFSRRVF